MDNEQLIKSAQSGDAKAFEQLLDSHYELIFRCALKWCGHRADAEDIAQQACIKLAGNIGQYRFESAFSTWLYRLVINCAKDWHKSQNRHVADREWEANLNDQYAKESSDVNESLVQLRQVLHWAEQFGEGLKETLLLVFGEGMSHGEAAQVLDVKESTISWRIHDFRQKLNQFDNQQEAKNAR